MKPTPEEIEAYFNRQGLTTAEARANLAKRGWSGERIEAELPVGLLCEQVLVYYKRLADEHPEVFWATEEES
jgi:hypothetical protein